MAIRKRRKIEKPPISLKPLMFTILWSLFFFLIFSTNPTTPGVIPLFIIFLFINLTLTLSILIKNLRRNLTISFITCFFLVLRYFNLGNALNLLLLIGTAIAFEIYLSNQN